MADFNLNCPACRMEYALPADAIPPEGRDVECSGCGHVWHARPPGPGGLLDLGRFRRKAEAERPIPPARQRLSADVLDILQEEVAHERRLRDADALPARSEPGTGGRSGSGTGPDLTPGNADPGASTPADAAPVAASVAGPPPPLPGGATGRGATAAAAYTATADTSLDATGDPEGAPSDEDADWPATTVVGPVGSTRAMTPTAQPPVVVPDPSASPVLLLRPAAMSEGRAAAPAPAPASPTVVEPSRPARRKGFGAGMALALALALAVLAAYLLAPVLAARDLPLTEQATALREALDQARLWLARHLPGIGA